MKNIIFILFLGLLINGCITINKTYYTPVETHIDTVFIKEIPIKNKYIIDDAIENWKFNPDNIHYIIPVNCNVKTTL